jgi:hypothetical protein
MIKKKIWSAIETALFYYSGDSTTGQVCSHSYSLVKGIRKPHIMMIHMDDPIGNKTHSIYL